MTKDERVAAWSKGIEEMKDMPFEQKRKICDKVGMEMLVIYVILVVLVLVYMFTVNDGKTANELADSVNAGAAAGRAHGGYRTGAAGAIIGFLPALPLMLIPGIIVYMLKNMLLRRAASNAVLHSKGNAPAQQQAKVQKPAVSEEDYNTSLIAIVRIISENDYAAVQEVTDCVHNPEEYYEKNKDILYDEGMMEEYDPSRNFKWLMLDYILQKHNFLQGRDWKDEQEDFIYFVNNLKQAKAHHISIDPAWLPAEGGIHEWSPIIEKKFEDRGMCLAEIDIDSDSYEMFVCTDRDLTTLQQLADDIGECIDTVDNA